MTRPFRLTRLRTLVGKAWELVSQRGIVRKLLVAVAAGTLFVVFALPVAAQEEGPPCEPTPNGNSPASGCTVNMHNLSDTFTDVVPCTDPPVAVVITLSRGNLVFHTTQLANGTYWATFTEEGSFSAVSATGVMYDGHFVAWDGEAWNLRNATFTATFNVTASASDGTRLSAHGLMHLNLDATGTLHTTMHFLC